MALAERRDPEGDLIEIIAGFQHNPLGFVRYAFPWGEPGTELASETGPRPWQIETLEIIRQALSSGDLEGALRIATASGHGIGKSALVSWVILWGLATFPLTKVVITANTGDQLRTKTWPEVSKWFNLLICRHWFKFEATSIARRNSTGSKEWRCDAATWSENNTAAFAGLHNKGRRILLLFDEASQIADKVWEVAEGALTDEDTEILWLVFGNPRQLRRDRQGRSDGWHGSAAREGAARRRALPARLLHGGHRPAHGWQVHRVPRPQPPGQHGLRVGLHCQLSGD